jgi:hypothetical protein
MPNLSQFYPVEIKQDAIVYTTGSQTVSGLKTFATRPQVNGVNVLLQGEGGGGGINVDTNTLVYTTGSQTINGTKSFTTRPNVGGIGVVLQNEISAGGNILDAFNGNRPITRTPVANTNYGGTTISGFLNNMFFPFIEAAISLNGFSTLSDGLFEYGQNYTGFKANVTINKNSDNNVKNLIIFQNTTPSATPLNLPILNLNEGTNSYTIPNIVFDRNSTTSLYARVETGVVAAQYLLSNNRNIEFFAPHFVGLSNTVIPGQQFAALPTTTKTVISKPTSFVSASYNPVGAQFAYFLYPWQGTYGWNSNAQTNGHIMSIIDQNGFETLSLFTASTLPITLTLSNGLTATYRLVRTTNTISLPFTFKFYFYT